MFNRFAASGFRGDIQLSPNVLMGATEELAVLDEFLRLSSLLMSVYGSGSSAIALPAFSSQNFDSGSLIVLKFS